MSVQQTKRKWCLSVRYGGCVDPQPPVSPINQCQTLKPSRQPADHRLVMDVCYRGAFLHFKSPSWLHPRKPFLIRRILTWSGCLVQHHRGTGARHEKMFSVEVQSPTSITVIVCLCVTTLKTVFKPAWQLGKKAGFWGPLDNLPGSSGSDVTIAIGFFCSQCVTLLCWRCRRREEKQRIRQLLIERLMNEEKVMAGGCTAEEKKYRKFIARLVVVT